MLTVSLFAKAKDHNPLLPQPQKVTYGNGQLQVKGLTIAFASKPSTEDRFAAQELAGILSRVSSGKIVVKESISTGTSIILKRTGSIDPLPVVGEKPGPNSREAYK